MWRCGLCGLRGLCGWLCGGVGCVGYVVGHVDEGSLILEQWVFLLPCLRGYLHAELAEFLDPSLVFLIPLIKILQ